MTASQLTCRYVGVAVPAANTVEGVLNALYTLGTAGIYADTGGVRTPGSGQAGTWERYQAGGVTEAVYCTPAADLITTRYILAGAAGAKAPTMCAAPADTWAVATVLFGVNKHSGAYNAWDNAAPFTSGQFTGFLRALALGTFTITGVYLYECDVGFRIVFGTSANTTVHLGAGEWIDPGVDGSGASPHSAEPETDTLILIDVNGSTVANSQPGWTTTVGTATVFFAHAPAANGRHCCVVTPGASNVLIGAQRTVNSWNASTTATDLTTDADLHLEHLWLENATTNAMLGRIREHYKGPDKQHPGFAGTLTTIKAYILGTSLISATDALYLGA